MDLMVDNIRLHVDTAIGEDTIGCSHLEGCHDDTLSEGHIEELDPRPFFVRIDVSVDLSVEGYIALISESEIVYVFGKERLSDFLDNVDHADVAAPV